MKSRKESPEEVPVLKDYVGGKPQVAHGLLYLSFRQLGVASEKTTYKFEKVFGLVKNDYSVLKFKLIVTGIWDNSMISINFYNKFIYLGNENITCEIKLLRGNVIEAEKVGEGVMCMEAEKGLKIKMPRAGECRPFRYKFSLRIGQDLNTKSGMRTGYNSNN